MKGKKKGGGKMSLAEGYAKRIDGYGEISDALGRCMEKAIDETLLSEDGSSPDFKAIKEAAQALKTLAEFANIAYLQSPCGDGEETEDNTLKVKFEGGEDYLV